MKLEPLPCLHAGVNADCKPDHAPGDIGLTAIIASLTQTAKMQCGEMFYLRVSLYQSAIIKPCAVTHLLTALHIFRLIGRFQERLCAWSSAKSIFI
jgi:hypothetical protein